MDVTWTEMLTKKFNLAELQAYLTLRNSRLGSEDQKRAVVESGMESGGTLEMKKMTAAIRMLGSNFFQEMTGQKRDKTMKVYYHLTLAADEYDESYVGIDEDLDEDTLKALAAGQDDDATMVLQFESAVPDMMQNGRKPPRL